MFSWRNAAAAPTPPTPLIMFCLTPPAAIIWIGAPSSYPIRIPFGEPIGGIGGCGCGCGGRCRCPAFKAPLPG